MLDLLTVGPKFTRPACRAAAAAIDRYLLQTHAANPPTAAAAVDRWDRQTDGRTDTRPLYDVYRILHKPRNKLKN